MVVLLCVPYRGDAWIEVGIRHGQVDYLAAFSMDLGCETFGEVVLGVGEGVVVADSQLKVFCADRQLLAQPW
jgi:hypothetical protein